MRTIALAASLLACSAVQAGTVKMTIKSPQLQLVDLAPADGADPALAITPTGLPGSSLAEWNSTFGIGGEFWSDFYDVTGPSSFTLTGILGAHSALHWTAQVVVDIDLMSSTPDQSEVLMYRGGVGGSTDAGFFASTEIMPTTFASMPGGVKVQETYGLDLLLKNDTDNATGFTQLTLFEANGYSDFVRPPPVPEPSTWVLMLGGLASAAAWRRRKA